VRYAAFGTVKVHPFGKRRSRYSVATPCVLSPMRVTRGGEEDALAAWVGTLEQIVAEKPTQWFNFFDVWNPFGP